MARIAFVAPIVRAALASLEAAFPAHAAGFNAEPENGVALADPVEYVFGASDPKTVYPSVEAFILEGSIGPFSLGDAGVGDADHDPRLTVIVWILGETGESSTVYEQALGYARCVIEILAEDGKLGPDAEVSAGDDAIDYRILPAVQLEDDAREIPRWKVPVVVRFRVEAVERWQ